MSANTGAISTVTSSGGTSTIASAYSGQTALNNYIAISGVVKSSFLSPGIINGSGLIDTNTTIGGLIANTTSSVIANTTVDSTLVGSNLQTALLNRFATTLGGSPFVGTIPTAMVYGDSFSKNTTYANMSNTTTYPPIASSAGVSKSSTS